jgi:hypothetical protein
MLVPRWGDSVQHTVIVQLMLDHGGLFESWEPYAPYVGLTTHFGFHANAAAFHWLTGIGAVQSVIWVGQMLNALAALALYPLGKRVGGRWAGVVAVLVSGLLSTMPMWYVNWGRYPQLAGQVLLPVGASLLWLYVDRARLDWRLLALNALFAVGQSLSYYRMPYYTALFALSLLVCVYVPRIRLRWQDWARLLARLAALAVVAGALLLPWVVHISQGRLVATTIDGAVVGRLDRVASEYVQWLNTHNYGPVWLLVLASLALILAAATRSWSAVVAGVWAFGLFGVTALQLVGIPGAAYMSAQSSAILMYAPVSLLIGWGTARAIAWSRCGWHSALLAGLLLASTLFGSYRLWRLSDPTYDFVAEEDLDAMRWIASETPPDARFLVNGALIFGDNSAVGTDAGWWIPLLAKRANTMPPQYALLTETELEPGYGQHVVELVAGLRQTSLSTEAGVRLLCAEGITHVYIGQGEGRVMIPPSEPLFTAQEMLGNPSFEQAYHQGRVWVFELTEEGCTL